MLRFSSATYIIASTQEKPHGQNVHETARPIANFPKKISSARYSSFTLDKQLCDRYVKEIEPMKEEVRKRIVASEINTAKKLDLIDTIERLGISYHFKGEIEEQLDLIHSGKCSSDKCSDLETVALRFRLFRQHGFDVSSDIFEQFMKTNGRFEESLGNDIKGLLNFYEAAHLRTHKDTILEDALIFTRNHLSSRIQHSCLSIEKQVNRALQQPLHRGIPRVEARHFISAYSTDKSKDLSLLRLAKLDYNLLQLMHQEELSSLLRWWKEMDLASKAPYARDRLVTSYLFQLATGFEPDCAMLRILGTKYMTVGIFVDDTYDAYATPSELDLLTGAMNRWDFSEVDRLPECVKIAFRAFMEMNKEIEQFSAQQGRPYAFQYVQEAWKEYAKCGNIQSKWFSGEKLPPFADYINIGWITCGMNVAVAMSFLAMESANADVFHWFSNKPSIIVAGGTAARLQNDLASHKFEKERGTATPIHCYMKSYNVSEQEAKHKFKEMYENCWKDINEEYSRKAHEPLTRDMFDKIINQARIMDSLYQTDQDILTDEEKLAEPLVRQLILEPFHV